MQGIHVVCAPQLVLIDVVHWIGVRLCSAIPDIRHGVSGGEAVTQTNFFGDEEVDTEGTLHGTVYFGDGGFFG